MPAYARRAYSTCMCDACTSTLSRRSICPTTMPLASAADAARAHASPLPLLEGVLGADGRPARRAEHGHAAGHVEARRTP